MPSIRELTSEASICLERSQSTTRPVVRKVLLLKAARLVARAEILRDVGVEKMPRRFINSILAQRRNGPADGPVVVAEFPTMTRREFIRTLPANHPARIAQEKRGEIR